MWNEDIYGTRLLELLIDHYLLKELFEIMPMDWVLSRIPGVLNEQ